MKSKVEEGGQVVKRLKERINNCNDEKLKAELQKILRG